MQNQSKGPTLPAMPDDPIIERYGPLAVKLAAVTIGVGLLTVAAVGLFGPIAAVFGPTAL
jgi:hypothetical protein